MTIHDELIYELIKLDHSGKPTGDIVKIVGARDIKLEIEEKYNEYASEFGSLSAWDEHPPTILAEMTPDVVAVKHDPDDETAIEIETDMDWNFSQSLQQIKKYKSLFNNVIVIIPYRYEKYARLYKSQGFGVWLWKATRVWECMRCGKETHEGRILKPNCHSCKDANLMLKGLKDVSFEEFGEKGE